MPGPSNFISGLPDGRRAPIADARGLAVLERIRAYAGSSAAVLDPLCTRRFDGSEWLVPDPADVAAKEDCDAIVRLVDLIAADKHLCALISARLAASGRSRPSATREPPR